MCSVDALHQTKQSIWNLWRHSSMVKCITEMIFKCKLLQRFRCVGTFAGMSSPTRPTSLSSSPQTWSSAWCSLTTMQVSHEPACPIRLIPPTHPARRAPQFTPSLPPTGLTAAARPAKAATNTSKNLYPFYIPCVCMSVCMCVCLLIAVVWALVLLVFFLPRFACVVCAFALWWCACDVCPKLTLDPLVHCYISATLYLRTTEALACLVVPL